MFSPLAQARLFQFGEHSFGAYVRGSYGLTGIGQTAFGKSSGTSTVFDSSVTSITGGEFGVLLTGKSLNLRLGVDFLYPNKMNVITGVDGGGTPLMTLSSQIIGLVPMAHVEFILKQTERTRLLLIAGAGYGTVTILNDYVLTAAGKTAYPTVSDFSEEVSGYALVGDGAAAFEFLFSDSTTMVVDAGYRYFRVDSLTHKQATTTFQGRVTQGQAATYDTSGNRGIDLSGAFAGLSLRFYF